jgi:hypothetical protein
MRMVAGTLIVLGALLACEGGDAEPDNAAPDTVAARDTVALETPSCSAAGLDPNLPVRASSDSLQPESAPLPPAVAEMRRAILRAAVACDYAKLEELALAGGETFIYSFGNGTSPAEYWREAEAAGENAMAMLVRTLGLPYSRETLDIDPFVLYIWPSAYLVESGEEDWTALAELYSPEDIELFKEYGSFIGWRVGLTETGDWRFFVAGD